MLINLFYKFVIFLVYLGILPKRKTLKGYKGLTQSFDENFNGELIDENIWMTHYYWGHNIPNNNEVQWYTNDSFTVSNSVLTIHLTEKNVNGWKLINGTKDNQTYKVTSGLIHTGESFKQKFGRFEIRCKLPLTDNVLPSFWLINPESYPPEIDIFDFTDSDGKSYNVGFIYGDDNIKKFNYSIFNTVKLMDLEGWNIFSLDWTPKRLTWYLNGYPVYTYSGPGIPQTPMYIAINLAADNNTKLSGNLNQKMLIDWVQVFKYNNHE